MFKRPFTAICRDYDGTTTAMAVDVPDGRQPAYDAAQEKFPNLQIVAMIPGAHAGHTHVYDSEPPTGGASRVEFGDCGGPWPENLPPGF